MRLLTVDDLTERARARLEEDYQNAARREKASREDFAAGWIACATRLGVHMLFDPAAWEEAKSP